MHAVHTGTYFFLMILTAIYTK